MKYLLLLLALGSASVDAAAQRVAQVQIKTSAECAKCKRILETAMAREKGVQTAELDLTSRILTVVYRPGQTSADKLRQVVVRMDYDPDSADAETRSYNRLEE
jgi:periplasmic mercuric ion binding protein